MWQQRACYEQSNVVDVTIQCQLNVSAKNVAEFSTMYGQPSYAHHAPSRPTPSGHYQAPPAHSDVGNLALPPSYAPEQIYAAQDYHNVTPKRGFECDYASSVQRISDYDTPKYGFQCSSDFVNNLSASEYGYYTSCMNDSGYGSPGIAQPRNVSSAFSPCVQTQTPRCTSGNPPSTARAGECDSRHGTPTYPALQQSASTEPVDEPTEEMKIALRERDVMQRLFSLRTADVDGANSIEHYYQSQSAVIDLERHNVLCQMAYDRKSSDSIQKYYNRKLLSLLECVEERLGALETGKHGDAKRQAASHADKKSRLLPKHAVKLMETWYQENLENPYPSRETTLNMAAEGNITVEQIRKWFANKRNRSRNSRLKASDVGTE